MSEDERHKFLNKADIIMKLRSTVKPDLLRKTLFKGTLIGLAGATLILITGTLFTFPLLEGSGFLIITSGFSLIAIGLIPYRRLSSLETKPHELFFDGEHLFFAERGKPLLKVPTNLIDKIEYHENKEHYGIGVHLKSASEKITVLQKKFKAESFTANSMERFNCPLFFPYFSKQSYHELDELLNGEIE